MLSLIRNNLAASSTKGIMLAAVELLADVVPSPMPGKVARLDLSGPRPMVWLNPASSVADLQRVLPEIIAAIANGPHAAPTADSVQRLTAVS